MVPLRRAICKGSEDRDLGMRSQRKQAAQRSQRSPHALGRLQMTQAAQSTGGLRVIFRLSTPKPSATTSSRKTSPVLSAASRSCNQEVNGHGNTLQAQVASQHCSSPMIKNLCLQLTACLQSMSQVCVMSNPSPCLAHPWSGPVFGLADEHFSI